MKYCVYDNWNHKIIRSFTKKDDCKKWLYEGLFGCEGAESEHYKSMLAQLLSGKKVLEYWRNV